MYCLPYNRRNFGNCQWPTLQKSCFENVGVGYRTFEIRDHLTLSPKLVPCPKILNPNRKLKPLIWNSRDEFVWKESSYTRTFAQKTIVKFPMSVLSISYLSPSQEENKNEREKEALVLHTCVMMPITRAFGDLPMVYCAVVIYLYRYRFQCTKTIGPFY